MLFKRRAFIKQARRAVRSEKRSAVGRTGIPGIYARYARQQAGMRV